MSRVVTDADQVRCWVCRATGPERLARQIGGDWVCAVCYHGEDLKSEIRQEQGARLARRRRPAR